MCVSMPPAVRIRCEPEIASVALPHSRPGVIPSITCELPALPMPQMRPSLMTTSAFKKQRLESVIVTLVINRSGSPPGRVIRLSMPMPSRSPLPPPKSISSPLGPRRSRSISTKRPVSPSRMRSPTVGPNRATYSLRAIVAIVRPSVGNGNSALLRADGAEAALRGRRDRLHLARLSGLAGGRAVDQVVEAVHGALAAVGHEFHLALVARLEPDRGRRGNVEVLSEGGGAVELERGVHLEEMEMRADLHRAVARVADLERSDRHLLVVRHRVLVAHVSPHRPGDGGRVDVAADVRIGLGARHC